MSAPAHRRSDAVARHPRLAALGALGAVAVLVAAGFARPAPAPPPSRQPEVVPVASAEVLCPATVATDALTSVLAAGVAPVPGVSDGVATLAVLSPRADAETQVISAPGATVVTTITGTSGPARLARATGTFVAGFGADQQVRSGQGASRGLAAAPCTRAVTEGWLVGGASTVGRVTQIFLVNDDDRPAQVDVLVHGPDGPVSAPAGSGIVVPASARSVVRLDALAPDQPVTAVHVVARSGRIGVAALDTAVDGLIPLGTALLPVSAAARTLVIPSVPAPTASARLLLVSPDSDTTVGLRLLTSDGAIAPVGLEEVDLEAGRVTAVDLAEALAGAPAGILLTADADIVAGVEVGTGGGTELRERDTTAPVVALTGPGVVTGLAAGANRHTVALATPGEDSAVVRLDLYAPGAGDPVWTQTLTVVGGSSVRVAVPVRTAEPTSLLVVTPVSGGRVHASREVAEAGARGPLLALAPILPTRATTLVPPVVSLPGSAVRR
jgi:hypothetical protein